MSTEVDSRLDWLLRKCLLNVSACVRDFPEEGAMTAGATLSRPSVTVGSGASIGGDIATLPQRLNGCQIATNPGDSPAWTATDFQVLSRGSQRIVMHNSTRPFVGVSNA